MNNDNPDKKKGNPRTAGMTKEEKRQYAKELEAFFKAHREKNTEKKKVLETIPKAHESEIKKRRYCGSDVSEITIPSKIVTIKREAFLKCKYLKRVIFNNDSKIEVIETSAFRGCPKLKEINFPKKIIKVYGVAIDFRTFGEKKTAELIKLLTAPIPKKKKVKGNKAKVHTKYKIRRANAASPNDAKGRHYHWYNSGS